MLDPLADWPREDTSVLRLGLHRMWHRTDAVETGRWAVTVRTRVAPAGTDLALRAVYRWTATEQGLRLTVGVEPGWRPARLTPRTTSFSLAFTAVCGSGSGSGSGGKEAAGYSSR